MFKFPIYSFLKNQAFSPLKVKNCLYRKGPKLTSWSTLNSILHSLRNVFFFMVVLSKLSSCGRQPPEVLYAHLLPKSYYLAIPEKCCPLNSSYAFSALPLYLPYTHSSSQLLQKVFLKARLILLTSYVTLVIFYYKVFSDKFWSLRILSFHHSSLLHLAVGLSLDF